MYYLLDELLAIQHFRETLWWPNEKLEFAAAASLSL
jgi:hypothetical protein